MKLRILSISLLLTLLGNSAFSQTTEGTPVGTTGVCKDGSFSTAATKAGACAGHKGVKTWMGLAAAPATDKSAPTTAATATAKASGASTAVPATPAASVKTAAAGAGSDKVWVNSESKVYHCPGTKYYGKTKKGSYMSEAEATAAGNHADHKKVCVK